MCMYFFCRVDDRLTLWDSFPGTLDIHVVNKDEPDGHRPGSRGRGGGAVPCRHTLRGAHSKSWGAMLGYLA